MHNYELVWCIVDDEKGTKALKLAKRHGIQGGTILLGRGTVRSRLLKWLDLNEMRKEIVLMAADTRTARAAAAGLSEDLAFQKPGHGIAFTMPITSLIGAAHGLGHAPEKKEDGSMHIAIFTIVDKGLAEDVIDAANSAGARGGTIFGARGSGIHETEVLFHMPVEPEREVTLIVAKAEAADAIIAAIRSKLKLDEPGRGILFAMDVGAVHGLHDRGAKP